MKQKYLEQIWTYVCSRCRGEISFLIYVDKKEIKIPVHLYPNLCDLMDCSPWGTSVHGILQTRTLKWVAIPFSRGSSQLRDWTQVSCIAGEFFTSWATREVGLVGPGHFFHLSHESITRSEPKQPSAPYEWGLFKLFSQHLVHYLPH